MYLFISSHGLSLMNNFCIHFLTSQATSYLILILVIILQIEFYTYNKNEKYVLFVYIMLTFYIQ